MTSNPKRAALPLLAFALAGCGQKGPLYIPDTTQGKVVTRPATTRSDGATTGPSNSPSTPDSPGRAASPTPEVTAPADDSADPESKDPESKDQNKKQPPK